MGYGRILIYAVDCDTIMLECISLYVSHAMWCLFWSVLLQQVWQCHTLVQHCHTQLQEANHVVHKLSFASCFTYLTQYAAPYRSMDVGGAPSLSLKCESWLLMPIWEFNSLFTYLGGGSTPMARNHSIYFISFVSSNWVVISHQKGGDWKCN